MPEPLSEEKLAEIEKRAGWPDVEGVTSRSAGLSPADALALLAEVRLGREALRDAERLLGAIERSADVINDALRKAGVGGAWPGPPHASYEAKAKRIRAALAVPRKAGRR